MKKYIHVAFVLLLCTQLPLFSQTSAGYDSNVRKVVKKYRDSLGLVGISVAIIQDNEIKFKESFGSSNLELNTPMTNSSVYRIWSVSKQFCAVSLLKLEQQGALEFDDPISKYLDSLPDDWKNITILQLLGQTAGIKDYLNDYPEGKKLHSREYNEIVDSTQILKFNPGNKWSYSNTGYWVLTKIVEKVSGRSYQEFLKEEYFDPLGMSDTQKMDYYNIIPNRVNGYRTVKGVHKNSTRYLDENHLADGDAEVISTIDDLSIWAKALFSGKIIDLDDLRKAWEKTTLNTGDEVNASSIIYYDKRASYGKGWFISELEGHEIVWTPGAGRGFSTTIFSVPEFNLNIVVLCNTRRFLIADKIAKDIAKSLIP